MINTKVKLFLAASVTLLGGCTTGQDSFSTEPGKGFGWKSMSETNQIIQNESMGGTVGSPPLDGAAAPILPTVPQTYVVSTGNFSGIERIPEQYLRIWIPPYQDPTGNLHEESAIQTVIKGGQWKLPHPTTDYIAA